MSLSKDMQTIALRDGLVKLGQAIEQLAEQRKSEVETTIDDEIELFDLTDKAESLKLTSNQLIRLLNKHNIPVIKRRFIRKPDWLEALKKIAE